MLALLAPGVTTNKYSAPTQSFSVNGGRGRSNNFMIDGTDNTISRSRGRRCASAIRVWCRKLTCRLRLRFRIRQSRRSSGECDHSAPVPTSSTAPRDSYSTPRGMTRFRALWHVLLKSSREGTTCRVPNSSLMARSVVRS
jgi:hypothetical protein